MLPEGWQYGVVMNDGSLWGCGGGKDGRIRQKMRMRYSTTKEACLIDASGQQRPMIGS